MLLRTATVRGPAVAVSSAPAIRTRAIFLFARTCPCYSFGNPIGALGSVSTMELSLKLGSFEGIRADVRWTFVLLLGFTPESSPLLFDADEGRLSSPTNPPTKYRKESTSSSPSAPDPVHLKPQTR